MAVILAFFAFAKGGKFNPKKREKADKSENDTSVCIHFVYKMYTFVLHFYVKKYFENNSLID